jgi:hypothetical protein
MPAVPAASGFDESAQAGHFGEFSEAQDSRGKRFLGHRKPATGSSVKGDVPRTHPGSQLLDSYGGSIAAEQGSRALPPGELPVQGPLESGSTVVYYCSTLSDLNGCSQATRMLVCYTAALTAFHKSQEVLLSGMSPGHPKYPEARRVKDRAFGILLRARKVYWGHVTEHKCRRTTWSNCV